MRRNSAQEALPLDFGEPPMPEPEGCPFVVKRWHDKTCCAFRGREIWTNCGQVEHCVFIGCPRGFRAAQGD
jgi:hypothetical protein